MLKMLNIMLNMMDLQYSYSQFHATFALAAMYIAMLLTQWGGIEGIDDSLHIQDTHKSVWIKVIDAFEMNFASKTMICLISNDDLCIKNDRFFFN